MKEKVIKLSSETIDVTPTWSSLVPFMVEVLKNPKADNTAKAEITQELIRLAKIVDNQNKGGDQ